MADSPEDAHKKRQEHKRLMAEFLTKGGTVEKLEPGIAKGAVGFMGQKLQYTDAEIKQQAKNQEIKKQEKK